MEIQGKYVKSNQIQYYNNLCTRKPVYWPFGSGKVVLILHTQQLGTPYCQCLSSRVARVHIAYKPHACIASVPPQVLVCLLWQICRSMPLAPISALPHQECKATCEPCCWHSSLGFADNSVSRSVFISLQFLQEHQCRFPPAGTLNRSGSSSRSNTSNSTAGSPVRTICTTSFLLSSSACILACSSWILICCRPWTLSCLWVQVLHPLTSTFALAFACRSPSSATDGGGSWLKMWGSWGGLQQGKFLTTDDKVIVIMYSVG